MLYVWKLAAPDNPFTVTIHILVIIHHLHVTLKHNIFEAISASVFREKGTQTPSHSSRLDPLPLPTVPEDGSSGSFWNIPALV